MAYLYRVLLVVAVMELLAFYGVGVEGQDRGASIDEISVDSGTDDNISDVPALAPSPIASNMIPTLSRALWWVPGVGGCVGTTCVSSPGSDDDDYGYTPPRPAPPTPRPTPRPTHTEDTYNDYFWPGISVGSSSNALSINIRLDDYSLETSWKFERKGTVTHEFFVNGTQSSVSRGNNSLVSTSFAMEQWIVVDQSQDHPDNKDPGNFYSYVHNDLAANTLYRFTIADSANDGICCAYSAGWATLLASQGILWSVADNFEFTSQAEVTLWVDGGGDVSVIPGICTWVTWLEECNSDVFMASRSTLTEFIDVMTEQGDAGYHLVAVDYSESEMTWLGSFQRLGGGYRWSVYYTWDDFLAEANIAIDNGYRAEALYYGHGVYLSWYRYVPGVTSNFRGNQGNSAFWNALNEEMDAGRHMTAGFGSDQGYWFAWFEARYATSHWNHAFTISQLQDMLWEYWETGYYVTAIVHSATDGWILWAELDYSSSGYATRTTVPALWEWITDNWEGYCISAITHGCEY